jgi:hypothetical protein
MNDRDIMKQALDALERYKVKRQDFDRFADEITALRERLAQPEPEPKCGAIIEVFGKDWRLDYMSLPVGKHKLYTQQYIYTAPPQRKPLTDEQIDELSHTMVKGSKSVNWLCRAIEAAHGIFKDEK